MNIKDFFWNTNEKRLRAVFRLLAQAVIFGALLLILGLVAGILLFAANWILTDTIAFSLFSNVLNIIVMSGVFLLGPLIGARWIDKRSLTSLGFSFSKQWWKDIAFGLFLGGFLMLIIFLVELSFGWVSVEGFFRQDAGEYPFIIGLVIVLFQFIMVGIYEETFFRGYLLTNFSEGFTFIKNQKVGLIVAYILTSSIFGIMHMLNPNTTLISTLNITLAGLFLGLGYVLTGNIGLSIGIHITWNFFQGNVFGFPVSGVFNPFSFIDSVQHGNELITGGDFGPEAGLMGIVAMILGTMLTLLWVKWQYGEIKFKILENFIKPIEEPALDLETD
ncbi:MAG: CPBP family intramembrane metalloprotease [Anaerolineaceae bacterium]|nr:CPBP family intramembrane metalloprotease [Anaerolineaceae bacterium]